MRRLNSHCPRSPMYSLATCSPASRPTSTERIVPRPPSAVKIAMATRLVPPPAAQHPNMPPYVAGDAQFPKDVAVSGRSNRPLTTKARATLARPDRTLPASAKSRYKEDERSDNEIGLTEENSAWHALNSRQAVLLPETCVGHIDRRIARRGGIESAPVISAPASSWAESTDLNQHSPPRVGFCPFAIPRLSSVERDGTSRARSSRLDTK